jgi:broad specificity phosphatase PhoE
MKAYLVRHAESVPRGALSASEARRAPLSAWGRKQAEAAGRFLRGKGVGLVITSQYARAQETAQAIARVCGARLIIDERLSEWEPVESLKKGMLADAVRALRRGESLSSPVSEDYESSTLRVRGALDGEYAEDAVCIVAHELILQNLLMSLTGADEAPPLALASVSCLETTDRGWRVVYANKKLRPFSRLMRRLGLMH